MDQTRPFICVLDDEPQFGKALARLLKTHGFEVVTFTGGEEFLEARNFTSETRGMKNKRIQQEQTERTERASLFPLLPPVQIRKTNLSAAD